MFPGMDADAQRLAFFSSHHESFIAASTDTHVFRVRAVASYKHLGVRFQMDADLYHEVQSLAKHESPTMRFGAQFFAIERSRHKQGYNF